jgi:hypothetical protein
MARGAAEDLLHVHPRRPAVVHRLAAVAGEPPLAAGPEVEGVEVAVAGIGDPLAVR